MSYSIFYEQISSICEILQVLNKYVESRRCSMLQDLPVSQGDATSYGLSGVGGDSKTSMFQGHLVPFRAHQPGARSGV